MVELKRIGTTGLYRPSNTAEGDLRVVFRDDSGTLANWVRLDRPFSRGRFAILAPRVTPHDWNALDDVIRRRPNDLLLLVDSKYDVIAALSGDPATGLVGQTARLHISQNCIVIPAGCTITATTDALRIQGNAAAQLSLQALADDGSVRRTVSIDGDKFTIPLEGPLRGCLCFSADLSALDLFPAAPARPNLQPGESVQVLHLPLPRNEAVFVAGSLDPFVAADADRSYVRLVHERVSTNRAPRIPLGKAAELLVLGLFVGAFSLALSFLWKGYVYKASDLIQYVSSEIIPNYAPTTYQTRLPFPLIFLDIGEETCADWARSARLNGCADLPRFPRAELAKVFQRLAAAHPKLLVVDVDLREETGSNYTEADKQIRDVILQLKDVPVIVAQPLDRVATTSGFDYHLAPTILHDLSKDNLRFGQVEQYLDDEDGVERRFPAALPVDNANQLLNPKAYNPAGFAWHLALRVCELITDVEVCGHRDDPKLLPPRFGARRVSVFDNVQFRYALPRRIGDLIRYDVKQIEARNSISPELLKGAVVILGSTARGRGDFHTTPLDVLGGDTPGVVMIANEVIAALNDSGLEPPRVWGVLAEKLVLILISTALVWYLFWYRKMYQQRPAGRRSVARRVLSACWLGSYFALVVIATIAINALLVWTFSFYLLGWGEVTDPVTPVVAAVLDAVVDLSATTGHKVAGWVDRWWGTLRVP